VTLSKDHIRIVARGTLLELWRRQDIWILTLYMGVFTLVALGARFSGESTPADGTFMLNLGMSLAVLFAHGLTALIAVRQFPNEIEHRTLYPLLARPLSRDSMLMGKWLACFSGGVLCFLAFHVTAVVVTPAAEPISRVLHVQHLLAQGLSLAWAAALGIVLSLCLPRALALGSAFLCIFGGETLFRWLVDRIPVLPHLLPRIGALNLATRLTDGIAPLSFLSLLAVVLYALAWTGLCLMAARTLWIRRAL
jgi:ABC-type transport system involved in multi-copper enzyme maturation permease subunit